jgi:hypothetical protein
VQNADSPSLFDELDAALQSGSSAKRVAMPRRADLLPSEADCLRDRSNQAVSLVLLAIAERNSPNMTPQRGFGGSAR